MNDCLQTIHGLLDTHRTCIHDNRPFSDTQCSHGPSAVTLIPNTQIVQCIRETYFNSLCVQLLMPPACTYPFISVEIKLHLGIGEHDRALQTELKQMLQWMPALDLQVVPADEEGMIARLCQRAEAAVAEDQRGSRSEDV